MVIAVKRFFIIMLALTMVGATMLPLHVRTAAEGGQFDMQVYSNTNTGHSIIFDFSNFQGKQIYFMLPITDSSWQLTFLESLNPFAKMKTLSKTLEIDFFELGFTVAAKAEIKGKSSKAWDTGQNRDYLAVAAEIVSVQSEPIAISESMYNALDDNTAAKQLLTVMSNGSGAKVYTTRVLTHAGNSGLLPKLAYVYSNDVYTVGYTVHSDGRNTSGGGYYDNAPDKNNNPSADEPVVPTDGVEEASIVSNLYDRFVNFLMTPATSDAAVLLKIILFVAFSLGALWVLSVFTKLTRSLIGR